MPRTTVAQLKVGMTLSKNAFLLRERSSSTTRAGSPMLRVTLADCTGSVPGVLFDAPGHVVESLTAGQGVEVSGRVSEFKDQLQISIERLVPATLTHPEEFLPMARRPLQEMSAEFDQLRASVREPSLAALLNAVFGDAATYRDFVHAPAATAYHHACVGGLLEHTLSVTRLVIVACDLSPQVNRDLAVTAAFLHDLGKVRAYDPISFARTPEGYLWGHVYLGAIWAERAMDSVPGFGRELRRQVIHAILAHQGKLEYGSPKPPMTLEAIVVHHADNLDADERGALDYLERSEVDGQGFTERSPMHATRLYRGQDRPAGGPEQGRLC